MARSIYEEPGFEAYVRACKRFPVLDREQELHLARRFRDHGDRRAADALVESHLRSVVQIAQRYRGYGIYLSDLSAEGNLGLLDAVKRYDPERGLRFLTYARYWIRAHMLAHILKHWSIVDLGTTALQSKLFFRLQGEQARLTMKLGDDGDGIATELAAKFNTSVERVRVSLSRLSRRDTSLDAPVMPNSSLRLIDTLRDTTSDAEETTASAEIAALVHASVDSAWPGLDERERMIVERRLLPASDEPETLAALGREIGLTRERVRQIEAQVKQKLRMAYERAATARAPSRHLYESAAA